ncbi:PREDICTED: cytochrome P450 76A2-like [Ipomoea nil]|uniref:cytochrome P450 76A2-like n=1 Tax=Ipomoea nil TaxID=35883 RepID=UPI0009008EBB|nr:PREDICTED: cytochrome P450 76A2-like [Ipomoea nil]
MEWEWKYLVWSAIFLIPGLVFLLGWKKSSCSYRLPPGPPGLPVIGNMLDLGAFPHQTTAEMKNKYGSLIWLRIGSVSTMVILSAKAAAELFKNHDVSFADRKVIDAMKVQGYHKGSLAIAPYGSYWRMLRRICTVELFVHKRINETVAVRRKCIDDMLLWIEKEASSVQRGTGVHVAHFVFLSTFNLMGNLFLSRDLVDPMSDKASKFFYALTGVTQWFGTPNISDIFPGLRWLDLQGLRRKADRDVRTTLEIVSTLVKERMNEDRQESGKRKDFLDVLLEFEGNGKDEPAKLSEQEINIFVTEMFFAGTETTSSSVEWALSELLCNPKAMAKVKEEIYEVVGPNRRIEESDIDNLQYMQAVVKETLRLHPPLPFLIPRRAIQDTKFMEYDIPKDTQVFVNVWAIGRDPESWDDPLSFKPERFLGSNIDFKGQDFEFLPFGAGRRICVGLPLGNRMLHFILGSLLHAFDWELECNVTSQSLDMKERMGIAVSKSDPLKAIPRRIVA